MYIVHCTYTVCILYSVYNMHIILDIGISCDVKQILCDMMIWYYLLSWRLNLSDAKTKKEIYIIYTNL